jgi:pyruvate dehydrogenase E2 component (dihydrolipoyllysine-residue acetyltransferase)
MKEHMPVDVIMPALGMAQETGKVLRWLRADGDNVTKGEPLLEVETDKVTVEIEAPADGTLAGVSAVDGAEVPVGTVIALVLAEGEALAAVPHAEPEAAAVAVASDGAPVPSNTVLQGSVTHRRRLASPKARRLAAERGVDLAAVVGSGPGGAIVAADVATAGPAVGTVGPTEAFEVGTVWRVMAERTAQAWRDVPHFVLTRDVVASRLQSWREVARRKPGCEGVTVTDLLLRICAEALRRHPRVNASWSEGRIVPGPGVNVGIAVATDEGLVVPVVHGADALPLAAVSARRREVAEAARQGTLRLADVEGGTFTISNLGMYGVDGFQAIVNAPQAAILAVGRIAERPVVLDGEVVARPVLTLTVSFDHRVVDGARGAEFLDTLAALVEEPAGLVE